MQFDTPAFALATFALTFALAIVSVAIWNRTSLLPYQADYDVQGVESLGALLPIDAAFHFHFVTDGFSAAEVNAIQSYLRSKLDTHADDVPGLYAELVECSAVCDFSEVLQRRATGSPGHMTIYIVPPILKEQLTQEVSFTDDRAALVITPSARILEDSKVLEELTTFLSSPAPSFGAPQNLLQGQTFERYHISLTLLNAAPSSWVLDWDGEAVMAMLRPFLNAISTSGDTAVLDIEADSQVVNHGSLPEDPVYEDTLNAYTIRTKAMERLLLVNDWKLNSFTSARQEKALNFVVLVPPAHHCPILLRADKRSLAATNAFIWPSWGGVALFCPSNTSIASPATDDQPAHLFLKAHDLTAVIPLFVIQLRQLLGITWSLSIPHDWQHSARRTTVPAWEIDLWHRQLVLGMTTTAATSVAKLHQLLRRLPSMPLADHIAEMMADTIADVKAVARSQFSTSTFQRALHAVQKSEDAFFDQSLLGQLYFPDEHKLAVFAPFFLPLLFTLFVGLRHVIKQPKQPLRDSLETETPQSADTHAKEE